jgi:tRNA-binding EMAP/Myf-like protein
MEANCGTCDSVQPCELAEEGGSVYICETCGDEVQVAAGGAAGGKYDGYVIGRVLSVDAIPKQKDLKKTVVDIVGDGDIANALTIVTNAKYIDPAWLVVVATQGAIVPAGAAPEDTDAVVVSKRSVGGVASQGKYGAIACRPMY